MRPPIRPFIARASLTAFLAIDLLGLTALLYDQLFAVESPYLWIMSAVLVAAAMPWLVRASDYLATPPERKPLVRSMGEKIP